MPSRKGPSVNNEFCIPLPGSFFRPGLLPGGQMSGIDWENARYDPRAERIHVGDIGVGVGEPVGPKTQVFSENMPPQWTQLMMGFMNAGKDLEKYDGETEDCELDGKEVGRAEDDNVEGVRSDGKKVSVFPREEYVRMWITCDEELYMERMGDILIKVEKLLDALERRETRFARAGTAKRKVDDMLEYSVRLATGAKVLQDEDAALRTLGKIVGGQFPKEKIAIAHNMLCYLHKKRFAGEAIFENLISTLLFADFAAASGPFTHCLLTFSYFFAPLRKVQPYNSFTALWAKYEEYKEKWGLIDPAQRVCVVCETRPVRRRDLKKCAGSCLVVRKPLYCGKACQRKHWPTHKQWCGKDFTPTESDLESDMYYADFTSEDEDEDSYFTSSSEGDYNLEDEEGESRYTMDGEGSADGGCLNGPSLKRPQLDDSDSDESDEEWFSGEEDTDESFSEDHDDRSLASDSKNAHDLTSKKKKLMWGDYGDVHYLGFVMNLARSIVRMRNT